MGVGGRKRWSACADKRVALKNSYFELVFMRELIRKYALQNAVFFQGKAAPGAIIGKVLAERPELKSDVKTIGKLAGQIAGEVNKMTLADQKAELEKIDSSLLEKVAKDETKELKDLPDVKGKVTMRFAPNPNGPLHIGHCRQALLNDEYVKRYGGTLILRFDDTDPKTPNKRPMPEAYQMIQDDLKWLGVNFSRVERASARLPIYISYFDKLVDMGKGYICTCDPTEWRELRRKGKACPCRARPQEEQVKLWEKFQSNDDAVRFKEGEAVARVKTDLSYKDPAARDWAAFRIIDKPNHPRTGNEFKLWPMLDFASAIDDHEFEITHIIRGKDLNISEVRQRYLYDYFGWTYPVAKTTGKLFVDEAVTSKSKILEGIKKGKYSGWDDPQLVTVAALRRRGFPPEAIREFVVEIGLKAVNATLDMGALEVIVKRIVDKTAKRMFFVTSPVSINVAGAPKKNVDVSFYPKKDSLGKRSFETDGKFFIAGDDFSTGRMRLKELYTVSIDGNKVDFESEKLGDDDRRHLKKIQWVPQTGAIDASLLLTDGSKVTGKIEAAASTLSVGDIIQLERIGYGKLDDKDSMTFVLTA